MEYSILRRPVVEGATSLEQVTTEVAAPLEHPPTTLWWAGFGLAAAALMTGVASVAYQVRTGIGTWGLNNGVGWAIDITSFVFWIGIGHAGTLISAVLFLFRQRWRTSINRSAEAMTLIAVMCAGLFPLIHMGRPWCFYFIAPYPNSRGPLWINWRSPLVWDCVAIGTYFTISAVFWYLGLVPDLATLRDRTTSRLRRAVYGALAFGWNGSMRVWRHHDVLYLLLAALATPLVLSVHSIVSLDFAASINPGWHSTLFPPYFVAGAIFSGLAMVLTLLVISRKVMRFERYVTLDHFDKLCQLLLAAAGVVALAYGAEAFFAWYSGSSYERFNFLNRALGPYSWAFWTMVACNVLVPQLFWSRRLRRRPGVVFCLCLLVNVGMWLERFVIIVTSLHRGFLPSSWTMYRPTWIELGAFLGSVGLFFVMFLLFVRSLPFIAISELKASLSYGSRSRVGSRGDPLTPGESSTWRSA